MFVLHVFRSAQTHVVLFSFMYHSLSQLLDVIFVIPPRFPVIDLELMLSICIFVCYLVLGLFFSDALVACVGLVVFV